jgi:DNA-binding FrmR family transcriptional regulator
MGRVDGAIPDLNSSEYCRDRACQINAIRRKAESAEPVIADT